MCKAAARKAPAAPPPARAATVAGATPPPRLVVGSVLGSATVDTEKRQYAAPIRAHGMEARPRLKPEAGLNRCRLYTRISGGTAHTQSCALTNAVSACAARSVVQMLPPAI